KGRFDRFITLEQSLLKKSMPIERKIQGLDHDNRSSILLALAECIDPTKSVLEAISEVLPVDKKGSKVNNLCWACGLILESLIPMVVDSIINR
ncbi:Frigida domain-containing protein, partial [Cephalotus follicularis]